LFRAAFGILILIQLILWGLFLGAIAHFVPEENYSIGGALLVILFIGIPVIGGCNHFLFQRFTRTQYLLAESQRWLTERQNRSARQIRLRNRVRRWAMWIPAVSVTLFCLFLDHTWPVTSQLRHAGYGRLGAYHLSLPLDWTVVFSEPGPQGSVGRLYVYANHWKGMLRSGVEEFLGRRLSMTSSTLACYSSPSENFDTFSLGNHDRMFATRTFSLKSITLTCEESVVRDSQSAESHRISCLTPEHDFYCGLYDGDQGDSSEFYAMLQRINKTK